ncbi:hypothetical protein JCM11251_000287 [Rhodosporidiobolus azoricus]
MSAADWARTVLSLSSGSQAPPKASDLPASAAELIKEWCDRLNGKENGVEETELLLRALRCCQFTEQQERVIVTVSPLLLETFPSIRLQAAGCLLQYVNSTSTDTLQNLLPLIVGTITRALSSLQFQLPSAPSSTLPRLACTCLRILNSLALKVPSFPPELLAPLATLLSTWIHHGRTASAGRASPASSLVDRGHGPAQSQLAFGVMSAFAQPPASPQRRRTRKDSEVSIACSRATSVGGGPESGSEDEGSRPADRGRDAAQIRLDALTCLRTLAQNNPRALHKHWALFLADSPYLRSRHTLFTLMDSDLSRSVRLQACAALSAMLTDSASYLAIAADRPSKASFTSLSSSVGETVSEMHSSLSSLLILRNAAGHADFHLALLDLVAKLAANSPYGRLQRPLAWTLAKAVLPMLEHVDPATVTSSASVLVVIVTRYTATSSTEPFDWDKLICAAEPLVETAQLADVQRAGWTLLSSTIPPQAGRDWLSFTRLFLPSASNAVQEARTTFLVALLRHSIPTDRPSSDLLPVIAHLVAALESPFASVRLKACEALAFPTLLASPDDTVATTGDQPHMQPWTSALSLASTDPSFAVRLAACRAIGLLAKADPLSSVTVKAKEENLAPAVQVLLDQLERMKEDEGGEVDRVDQAGIFWALANCCDALRLEDVEAGVDPKQLLRTVLERLECDSDDEKTSSNCLRIIGALFKLVPRRLAEHTADFERAEAALCASLAHPAAKVRWNAAIASSALIPALATACSPRIADTSTSVILALTSLLNTDSSFKARIHAVGALSVALTSGAQLIERNEVVQQAEQAKERLEVEVQEGKVPSKEKVHAEVLVKRLSAFLAQAASVRA